MSDGLNIEYFIIFATILFVIGIVGIFINRKNLIVILMSIEIMLLAVNINFVAFSVYLNDITGMIFTFIVLTVAAAEVAIGLAILLVYFRNRGNIDIENMQELKDY